MSRDHDGKGPFVPCTVCNGRGLVMVEIDGAIPFYKCSLGDGIGEQSRDYDERDPYIICTKCKGLGAQPVAGSVRLIR